MEGWKFWWGIAAFFLGGLATQLNSWLAYRRQRRDKGDDAADALRRRREEFELQHLVEFNELLRRCLNRLHEYTTAVRYYVHLRDTSSLNDQVAVQRNETHEAYTQALDDAVTQLGFILADDVRAAASDALNELARAATELSATQSLNLRAVNDGVDPAFVSLAKRVRAIYAGRSA
ncbi:hypothetical protein ACGFZR_23055 [Streptomyces sp. NPDC048241]|uniref:hypothetical protein n=1 Tax=Streptomyces sp. NPDC048241 TaxID=3365521 RepID=UPI00371D820F